ncbi:MAG: SDR family NAD(P)-dependent oxidoreductase [Wenzhouxiangella sp.]|nr:MAG: SDR family NAD(P)-dependent oxidoreductase [Wenzhouxiangella sp.]
MPAVPPPITATSTFRSCMMWTPWDRKSKAWINSNAKTDPCGLRALSSRWPLTWRIRLAAIMASGFTASPAVLRSLASLFFYARFVRSFSALGYRRAVGDQDSLAPDFSGQTWLVTGATGGIGRSIALQANHHGARVLAVARSQDRLKALKSEADKPGRLVPLAADLSLVDTVRQLPSKRSVQNRPIDVLVNNVGVLLNDHRVTEEGLETSFATNLLGPFVLTEELKEAGWLAADGVVINVSSGGMYGSPLKLEPMNCTDPDRFDGMNAYAMHKRALVELTRWWNGQWQGGPVAHVMHPGWVDTEGVRTSLPIFRKTLQRVLRTPEQGADTVLWLADQRPSPEPDGGIWLDRSLQPEHEFAWTRRSPHTAEDLVAYLRRMAG